MYHVNMLKRWFERNEEPDERVIAAVCIADHLEEDNEGIGNQLMEPRDTYRDVKIAETLSIEQRRELEEYLKEYSAVLTNVPGRTSVLKHSVITTSDIPVRKKPYQIPHALRYEVKKELMAMVEAGTVEPSVSPYASPVVIITKKDKTIRFCIDYRKLNQVTQFDPEPNAQIEYIIDRLGEAKYLSKVDLTKGYWQISLDDDAKVKSAFVTPFGHYQFTVKPFGMMNSAATFYRLVRIVLAEHTAFSDSFIDNTLALLAAISGCEPSLIADLTVKLNSLEIVAKRLFPNGWYAMVIRRVEYTPSFLVDLYNGTAITEFVLLTNQFAPISGLSSVPKLGAFSSKDICPLSSALISSKSAYKS